jgi:ATP-dependent Zn protease
MRAFALCQDSSTSLAAHEAGHAVAAVVLRLSLRYVTLRPRGPEDALTYTRTRRNESPDYLKRQAVCDLAGIAAEQLLNGRVIFASATGDIPHARGIAERLGVEDVQAFIAAKLREAETIVSANRAGVEAVRRALVERRTLKGTEVRALLPGT